jgi:uncharacterized protein involved in response to NO
MIELFRREPYRVLFPLGILLSWAGVGHWLLLGLGLYPGYQSTFHAMAQVQGALTCFALGFLLTFIPRRTGARPVSAGMLVLFVLAPIATTLLSWFHLWVPAQLCWWSAIISLIGFIIARARESKAAKMHASFIWVPITLSAVLASSFVAGAAAAMGPDWMWVHDLCSHLLLQGLLTGLIMGVGGLLLPVLTRGADVGAHEPLDRRVSWRAIHAGMALLFFVSFPVEHWAFRTAFLIRAGVTGWVLLVYAKLWRPPTEPGLSRWLLWISAWTIPLGYLLAAVFPVYWIAGLHLVFIGGFWLMALVIGSHVALSHGGKPELTRSKSLRLGTTAVLLLLAFVSRALVNLDPAHWLRWLALAAGAFLTSSLPWAALVLPVLLKKPSPRSPPTHSVPLPIQKG